MRLFLSALKRTLFCFGCLVLGASIVALYFDGLVSHGLAIAAGLILVTENLIRLPEGQKKRKIPARHIFKVYDLKRQGL